MKRKLTVGLVLAAALGLLVQTAAWATPVPIDDQSLKFYGGSYDPEWDTGECAIPSPAYASVNDGTFGSSDAYDGGFLVALDGVGFDDPDGNGQYKSALEQLTVGPADIGGLRIRRVDRALNYNQTLRSLVVLKNLGAAPVSGTVTLSSNLGSDSDSQVDVTSSGGAALTTADRWVITTDGDASGDPQNTQVFFGKGAESKVSQVIDSGDGTIGDTGCLSVEVPVEVPAYATRYLLFFAQMHLARETVARAWTDAKDFDARRLNATLLEGLRQGVRNRVLNFDLS